MCHLVLLLPVFGLAVFWLLPPLEAVFAYMIVLGVSLLLYQSILEAMRLPVHSGAEGLVGSRGVVERIVDRRCIVRVGGELFTARPGRDLLAHLHEGTTVVVTGVSGNSVEVKPA